MYTQCVTEVGEGGVLVVLEIIFCRTLTLCTYVTRFRTYKLLDHPRTKTKEGRGPRTDKQLP